MVKLRTFSLHSYKLDPLVVNNKECPLQCTDYQSVCGNEKAGSDLQPLINVNHVNHGKVLDLFGNRGVRFVLCNASCGSLINHMGLISHMGLTSPTMGLTSPTMGLTSPTVGLTSHRGLTSPTWPRTRRFVLLQSRQSCMFLLQDHGKL